MAERLNLLFETPPRSVPLLFWNRLRWVRQVARASFVAGVILLVAVSVHALRVAATPGVDDFLWLIPWYLLVFVLGLWLCVRVVRRRLNRYVAMHRFEVCTTCGYPLSGLGSSGCCPECGETYEINEVVNVWQYWATGGRSRRGPGGHPGDQSAFKP